MDLKSKKKQHYEKYFNLDMFVYSGDSNVIPLKRRVRLLHSSSITRIDHYTENEFYTFLSNMSISFRTEFINKLITKVKSQLKDLVINKQSFELIGGYTTIQFQLNDYIALKLFPDSEFETLKIPY